MFSVYKVCDLNESPVTSAVGSRVDMVCRHS